MIRELCVCVSAPLLSASLFIDDIDKMERYRLPSISVPQNLGAKSGGSVASQSGTLLLLLLHPIYLYYLSVFVCFYMCRVELDEKSRVVAKLVIRFRIPLHPNGGRSFARWFVVTT